MSSACQVAPGKTNKDKVLSSAGRDAAGSVEKPDPLRRTTGS